MKTFNTDVSVSPCICRLRVNHGAFNEILQTSFGNLLNSRSGDEYVMMGLINI
jgi:hypothetical protein